MASPAILLLAPGDLLLAHREVGLLLLELLARLLRRVAAAREGRRERLPRLPGASTVFVTGSRKTVHRELVVELLS